jgi:hypothetical protein
MRATELKTSTCLLVSAIFERLFGQEFYARVLGVEYLTVGVEDSLEASNELSQVACFQSLTFSARSWCALCLIVWPTAPARHQRFFDEGLQHRGQSVGEIRMSFYFLCFFQRVCEIFSLRLATECNKLVPRL